MRFLILIPLFIGLCVSCVGRDQSLFPPIGKSDSRTNLLDLDSLSSYSLSSFAFAFSKSSLFKENLSRRDSALLALSSLVLSDYIEEGMAQALDLQYENVRAYRVEYLTPDPYNRSRQIRASGLFMRPLSQDTLPLLVYLHPTLLNKKFAPSLIPPSLSSMEPLEDDRLMMIFLALQGYIVFAPDYVGYGSSEEQIHPYLHKDSIIQTTGHLLYAVEQALKEKGIPFQRDLFIMGYSQGGHSALAFAEALQHDSMGFEIQAVSAGGGPYDLLYTVREHFKRQKVWKILLGLFLQSYSYIYNWDLDDILKKKDYSEIIYDSHRHDSAGKAFEYLPDRIDSVFHSQFIEDILEKKGRTDYHFALEENSVYDWTPDFPVFLFHLETDQIVPYGNMETAYRSFRSRGAKVRQQDCDFERLSSLVDIVELLGERGEYRLNIEPDHVNCNFIFFLETSDYFESYRR